MVDYGALDSLTYFFLYILNGKITYFASFLRTKYSSQAYFSELPTSRFQTK
jgi:hypothetical protein